MTKMQKRKAHQREILQTCGYPDCFNCRHRDCIVSDVIPGESRTRVQFQGYESGQDCRQRKLIFKEVNYD